MRLTGWLGTKKVSVHIFLYSYFVVLLKDKDKDKDLFSLRTESVDNVNST